MVKIIIIIKSDILISNINIKVWLHILKIYKILNVYRNVQMAN
jgi:hypothetical protein